MKVQITTSSFGQAGSKPIDYLKQKNVQFKLNPYNRKLTEDEAIEIIGEADAVIAGTEPLTRKVLEKLDNLKVISRCGVGIDNIDIEAAKELGIRVFNTSNVHVEAVAELALTAILALSREIVSKNNLFKQGTWNKGMTTSLYNKNIGLIGYGKVARKLCELLAPFNVNYFIYDPYIDENELVNRVSLDELLKHSDIISLHLPYTKDNHRFFNRQLFEKAKKEVMLINTSRGGLIDEEDLFHFLKTYPRASAFLDVFESEPYNGKLCSLDNIILSPHIATATKETRENMELEAAYNIFTVL